MTEDVRQSTAWAKYLSSLGWISYRTAKNVNVEVKPTFLGSFVKVQRARPLDAQDIADIEKVSREHKADFIKIEPYIGQDLKVLEDAGYVVSWFPMTPPSTFYLNLEKSQEELWANISHSGKYRINRARREGATVEIIRAPNQEQLQKFYQVLKVTGKLKGFYVPPIRQLYAQADAFGENGFIIFVYDGEKQLCGAKWCCGYDDCILYVSGGTTTLGRQDHSGYLLLWESMLYFKNLGYKVYDLEGKDDARFPSLTKKWGGFSHFKEKFGGTAIEFPLPYVKYLTWPFKFLRKFLGFAV